MTQGPYKTWGRGGTGVPRPRLPHDSPRRTDVLDRERPFSKNGDISGATKEGSSGWVKEATPYPPLPSI